MVGNGILCFYENTATGCLKPECTFIHSRPRVHLRNNPSVIRRKKTILQFILIIQYVSLLAALTNPTKTVLNDTPVTIVTQVPEAKPDPPLLVKSAFCF